MEDRVESDPRVTFRYSFRNESATECPDRHPPGTSGIWSRSRHVQKVRRTEVSDRYRWVRRDSSGSRPPTTRLAGPGPTEPSTVVSVTTGAVESTVTVFAPLVPTFAAVSDCVAVIEYAPLTDSELTKEYDQAPATHVRR